MNMVKITKMDQWQKFQLDFFYVYIDVKFEVSTLKYNAFSCCVLSFC